MDGKEKLRILLTSYSETYLIFVALQCLAVPLAIFLTNPEKVQRNDGTKVKVIRQDSWRAEFLELWRICRRKDVRLIISILPFDTNFFSRLFCCFLCFGQHTSINTAAVGSPIFLFLSFWTDGHPKTLRFTISESGLVLLSD